MAKSFQAKLAQWFFGHKMGLSLFALFSAVITLGSCLCFGTISSSVYGMSMMSRIDYSYAEIMPSYFSHDSFLNLTSYFQTSQYNADVYMMMEGVSYSNSFINFDRDLSYTDNKKINSGTCLFTCNLSRVDKSFISLYIPSEKKTVRYKTEKISGFPGLDNYYDHEGVIVLPFEQTFFDSLKEKEYVCFTRPGDGVTTSRVSISRQSILSKYINTFWGYLSLAVVPALGICCIALFFSKNTLEKYYLLAYVEGVTRIRIIVGCFALSISYSFIPAVAIAIMASIAIPTVGMFGFYCLLVPLLPSLLFSLPNTFVAGKGAR